MTEAPEPLAAELWISLASLVRAYCAAHGLSQPEQAAITADATTIRAAHNNRWLTVIRTGSVVRYESSGPGDVKDRGEVKFTLDGRLHAAQGEEEMDMAAERWARELMQ